MGDTLLFADAELDKFDDALTENVAEFDVERLAVPVVETVTVGETLALAQLDGDGEVEGVCEMLLFAVAEIVAFVVALTECDAELVGDRLKVPVVETVIVDEALPLTLPDVDSDGDAVCEMLLLALAELDTLAVGLIDGVAELDAVRHAVLVVDPLTVGEALALAQPDDESDGDALCEMLLFALAELDTLAVGLIDGVAELVAERHDVPVVESVSDGEALPLAQPDVDGVDDALCVTLLLAVSELDAHDVALTESVDEDVPERLVVAVVETVTVDETLALLQPDDESDGVALCVTLPFALIELEREAVALTESVAEFDAVRHAVLVVDPLTVGEALALAQPDDESDGVALCVPLLFTDTELDAHVVALTDSVAESDPVPLAEPVVDPLTVGDPLALVHADAERDCDGEFVPLLLAVADCEPVGDSVPDADAARDAEGVPLTETDALAPPLGVAAALALALAHTVALGVAEARPLADTDAETEADAQPVAVTEPVTEADAVGEGDAVGEVVLVVEREIVPQSVAEEDAAALAVAETQADGDAVSELETEPHAEGDGVLDAETVAVAVGELDAVAVVVALAVDVVLAVAVPVLLAVFVALTVGEPETEPHAEGDGELVVEDDVVGDVVVVVERDIVPQADAEGDAAALAVAVPQTDGDAESEPVTEPHAEGDGELVVEDDVVGDTVVVVERDIVPQADAEGDAAALALAVPQTDGDAESEPETEPHAEGDGVVDAETVAEPHGEGDGERDIVPQADADGDAAALAVTLPQAVTDALSVPEPDPHADGDDVLVDEPVAVAVGELDAVADVVALAVDVKVNPAELVVIKNHDFVPVIVLVTVDVSEAVDDAVDELEAVDEAVADDVDESVNVAVDVRVAVADADAVDVADAVIDTITQ